MTLDSKYPNLTDDDLERLDHIVESLKHIVHYANGVLMDINDGKFTPAEARRTVDEIINSEGFDFISAIEDYGTLADDQDEVDA
jgi:2-methylisocitrate lyase-like PEP mutase family enzyme